MSRGPNFQHPDLVRQLRRTQLPLQCAFAETVDAAEGRTTRRTVLDARDPLFSQGHGLVGRTRTKREGNRVLLHRARQMIILNPLNAIIFPPGGAESPLTNLLKRAKSAAWLDARTRPRAGQEPAKR
jgi:hypothetical protein